MSKQKHTKSVSASFFWRNKLSRANREEEKEESTKKLLENDSSVNQVGVTSGL